MNLFKIFTTKKEVPTPNVDIQCFKRYPEVKEMRELMKDIVTIKCAYPDIIRIDNYGMKVKGLDIILYKSSKEAREFDGKVFFNYQEAKLLIRIYDDLIRDRSTKYRLLNE